MKPMQRNRFQNGTVKGCRTTHFGGSNDRPLEAAIETHKDTDNFVTAGEH
jgi:hypothetical protein